jgi:hypothetical protein
MVAADAFDGAASREPLYAREMRTAPDMMTAMMSTVTPARSRFAFIALLPGAAF